MSAVTAQNSRPIFAPDAELRFAMLGMIDGNGHPWSWSAIVNGYRPEKLGPCPYPVIPQYLNARPAGTVGQDLRLGPGIDLHPATAVLRRNHARDQPAR